MSTNRDVQLVIRARDEASRAFDQASKALEGLLGVNDRVGTSATNTGSRLERLVAAATMVDRGFAKVFGAADNAASRMQRLGSQLDARKAELAAIETQASAARMAIAKLSTPEAIASAGTGGLDRWASQLAGAKAELERLGSVSTRVRGEIAQLEGTQRGQLTTLQQIGSTATAAAAARDQLTRSIERETAAMRERERAAGVKQNVERSTGIDRNRGDYEQLVAQIRATSDARDAEIRKLREEEAATAALARAQEAQRAINSTLGITADPRGKQAALSAQVFQEKDAEAAQRLARAVHEAATAANELEREVEDVRAKLNPLAVVEADLARKQERVNLLFRQGKISAAEYEAALEMLKQEANAAAQQLGLSGIDSKGRPSLFGLTPYQLTNFSYQLNDIVTQLASGTSLTQTMAQQGGQLIQIFPRVGAAIVAAFSNPFVLAFAATVGSIVLIMREIGAESARLRAVEGVLTSMGEGARYSAEALAENVRELDHMGVSADDALASVRSFVQAGINPQYLRDFAIAARDMADVLGIEVTDANRQIVSGFDGTWESLMRLQDATGFMSREQTEQIRETMRQEGATKAVTDAFVIFRQRMSEGAQEARGPWTEAARAVDASWGNMLATFTGSFSTLRTLRDLLSGVAAAVGSLDDAAQNSGARAATTAIDQQIGTAEARLRLLEQTQRRLQQSQPGAMLGALPGQQRPGSLLGALPPGDTAEMQRVRREIEQTRAALQRLREERARASAATPLRQESEAERNRQREVAHERELLGLEGQLERARNEADRVRLAGEIAYREELQKTNNARRAADARTTAQMREQERIRTQGFRDAEREARAAARRRQQELVQDSLDNGRENLVSTFQGQAGRHERRNRAELMEFMRANGVNIDPAQLAWCAAILNAVLAANGLPMQRTAGGAPTMAARDFLSYGSAVSDPQEGDIVVLRRNDPRNPNAGHVGLFRGFDARGRVRVLGGNTGDSVAEQSFARDDVLGFRRAPSLGDVATQERREADRRAEQQEQYNRQIDEENARRQLTITQQQRLLGLSGEQLFTEQRAQAIETAVSQATLRAAQNSLELTAERRAEIERTVGAEWDLANAQQRATAAVSEANDERRGLLEALERATATGNSEAVTQLETQLRAVDERLRAAIDRAITFWQQFDTPQARTAIQNLRTMRDTIGRDPLTMRRGALELPVNELSSQRDAIMERIEFFEQRGDFAAAEQLETQLTRINAALTTSISQLDAFWAGVAGDPAALARMELTAQQVETIRIRLQATVPVTQDLSRQFLMTGRQINESLADGAVSAIDRFGQAVVEGKNVIGSLWAAFRQFAADFLRQIALMILKQLFFNAISGVMGGSPNGKSGLGGGVAKVAGSFFHEGGIVGQDGRRGGLFPADLWERANRFHSGGIIGLAPDEIPAILQRGEEVLTADDPRHRNNGGLGGRDVSLKIINAIDAGDMVSQGLATRAGEKAILNLIQNNPRAVRNALGG